MWSWNDRLNHSATRGLRSAKSDYDGFSSTKRRTSGAPARRYFFSPTLLPRLAIFRLVVIFVTVPVLR